MSSLFPARRTVPSPYGRRNSLPFIRSLPARWLEEGGDYLETRLDWLNGIPGIDATSSRIRCSWDALPIVEKAVGRQPPPSRLPLPDGFWRGQGTETFRRISKALYRYQKPMSTFLGVRDWAFCSDDMQMGKSLEVLAALEARGCERIVLVVPGFARMAWVIEVLTWLRKSHVVLAGRSGSDGWAWLPGKGRRRWIRTRAALDRAIDDVAVTIVNYDILQGQVVEDARGRRFEHPDFQGQTETLIPHWWDGGVIDEMHEAKAWKPGKSGYTRGALISMFTRAEQCPILYGLTGTPMGGRVDDYWMQFRLLGGPRVWGKKPWTFHTRYCDGQHKTRSWEEWVGKKKETKTAEYWDSSGRSNEQELRERTARFMWGRMRNEVAEDMPFIRRQLAPVGLDDNRKTMPTPPRDRRARRAKRDADKTRSTNASRRQQFALANMKVVGPHGLDAAFKSTETGRKVNVFVRYHENREWCERWIREAVRKRKYKLSPNWRFFSLSGEVPSDKRRLLCDQIVKHDGPCLNLLTIDSMRGAVSLSGITENHYLEIHDNLNLLFQSEARGAKKGSPNILSLFYAVPDSLAWREHQKLLPKLQAMDEIAGDTRARDLSMQLQIEYEKDLDEILAEFDTMVRPGMLDAEGESE